MSRLEEIQEFLKESKQADAFRNVNLWYIWNTEGEVQCVIDLEGVEKTGGKITKTYKDDDLYRMCATQGKIIDELRKERDALLAYIKAYENREESI